MSINLFFKKTLYFVPKLLFFITEDWYFCSHRLPLARAAIKAGFEVVLLTNVQSHGELIRSEGIRCISLNLQRSSLNLFKEIKTILRVIRIYNVERPDLIHHVAIKPILYGNIAAFLTGRLRLVNAFAGMGSLFISNSLKSRLIRLCIKRFFWIFFKKERSRVILQNSDDVSMFLKYGLIKKSSIYLIRGSGIDVTKFVPKPEPTDSIITILPARMLRDKGVIEFVKAAKIVASQGFMARFILVGDRDPENPSAIQEEQLQLWQKEQIIEWWGHQPDMPTVLSQSHIICLPSYREGLPKALLEAASCGKPIVATDVPGCREIVRDGVNGFLVPPRDALALAEALQKLIVDKDLRKQMGAKGREIVLQEFSEKKIISETLAVYQEILRQ